MAVDNLVERLSKADPRLCVVRLGHPARLLPQVHAYTSLPSQLPYDHSMCNGAAVTALANTSKDSLHGNLL